MNTTDAQLRDLVDRARDADADAWETLYRRAYPRLFAYARRRLATEEQAEDAVSETMIRAMDRIGDFTWTGAGIDGWLFGIARNIVYETYREGAKSMPTDPSVLVDGPGEHDADPLDALVADADAVLVRNAFATLGPDDRELLELRVVIGLDSAQVGAVMGRDAGAVRTAQSRAMGRLRLAYGRLQT